MIKKIAVFALLVAALASPIQALAWESSAPYPAPRKMVEGSKFFALKRSVIIKSDNLDLKSELLAALSDEGLRNGQGFYVPHITELFRPVVTLSKRGKISDITPDAKDGLRITVKSNKIEVLYTTEQSARRAMEILEGLTVTRGGRRMIGAGQYWDWGGANTMKYTNLIDIASQFLSKSEIEQQIKRVAVSGKRGDYLFLEVASGNHWRLESPTFSLVNPGVSIYPANDKYYTAKQIGELVASARRQHVSLVPVIDLFSGNSRFEQITGHSPHSVEGMRFVRNIIEQYAQVSISHKICLGSASACHDDRFVEFVEEVVRRNSLELISL